MQLRHLDVDNLYVLIACLCSLYNAATTKLDIDAFEAMKPYLLDEYGMPQETWSWKASADYAQLPVQRKADPPEGGGRKSVRIKVENRIFYAPQETQTLRGISLLTRAIKTHLCAVNGGTE